MIIGLTGHQRSGKDSVAAALVGRAGFTRFAFADAIRDVILDINPRVWFVSLPDRPYERLADIVDRVGWEKAKGDPEVRRLLQETGMAIRRIDPDFWTRITVEQVSRLLADPSSATPVVISDVRLPDEAAIVRSIGGSLVRVVRPIQPGQSAAAGPDTTATHVTETALDRWSVDHVVVNNTTLADLEDKAVALVSACGFVPAP